jgi:hypothetical protein
MAEICAELQQATDSRDIARAQELLGRLEVEFSKVSSTLEAHL